MEDFRSEYGIRCTFLQFCGIIQSIPVEWKLRLREGLRVKTEIVNNGHLVDTFKTMCHKEIYDDLICISCDVPSDRFRLSVNICQ